MEWVFASKTSAMNRWRKILKNQEAVLQLNEDLNKSVQIGSTLFTLKAEKYKNKCTIFCVSEQPKKEIEKLYQGRGQ